MKEKKSLSIHHYLAFPVLLTLGIFAFVSFLWLEKPSALGQQAGISVGYILEYQQNCACEWPPFSGYCYQENQCQINPKSNSQNNIVCKVQEGKGQWVPSCGNNIVDCSEQCDPTTEEGQRSYCDALFGNHDYYAEAGKIQTCTQTCTWDNTQVYSYEACGGYCGDGIVQAEHEQCESDGSGLSSNSQYLCVNCQYQGGYCGDGTIQTLLGEECELNSIVQSGSCLSTCKVKCDENFHFENGVCVSNTRECEDESGHGSGSQTWNIQTKTWGLCEAIACDPYYKVENGQCVVNSCNVLDQHGRIAGTGQRETSQSPCTNVVCNNPNTHRVAVIDGVTICEEARCSGPDTRTCDVANGVGFQKRTCDINSHPPAWNAWGSCQVVRCFEGYASLNGECVQTICHEPLINDCTELINQEIEHVLTAQQTRTCVTDPLPARVSDWSFCTITACEPGFRKYTNQANETICEASTCDPNGQTIDCTQEKANALSAIKTGTCLTSAHPPVWQYGLCQVQTCKEGFQKNPLTNVCEKVVFTLSGYAWSENIGWLEFGTDQILNNAPVNVPTMSINENNASELIMQDPDGNLIWNDVIGWLDISNMVVTNEGIVEGDITYLDENNEVAAIDLQPSCSQLDPDCGVKIETNGQLTGYAWDTEYGWIHFNPQCSIPDPNCGVKLNISSQFANQFFANNQNPVN